MDPQPQTHVDGPDHRAHEQQLAAALRDLIRQVDMSDYRDRNGRPIRDSEAFREAQLLVDSFGVTHEQLCLTLDDCDLFGDLSDAARNLIEMGKADPSSTPAEYRTWTKGR
jgi:hypothetical protein